MSTAPESQPTPASLPENKYFPAVGEVCDVRSSRFGRATVKVVAFAGDFVDVEIVAGWLLGMREEWGPGDRKGLRIADTYFYPKKNP